MSRKQRTEGQAKRDLVKLCAFVALIIAAFTFTFGGLFNGSIVGDILNLVAKIALLIAIAVPAYQFSRGLNKGWKIVFWIALVIYVLVCVFGMLNINIGK